MLFALLALCMLLAGGLLVLGSGRVDGIVNAFLAAWDLFGRVAMAAMTALGFLLAYLFGNRRMMEQRQITQQDSPAYHRIAKVEDEVKEGDIVRVKVLDVNTEAKRISLSIREVLEDEAMDSVNDEGEYDIADIPGEDAPVEE